MSISTVRDLINRSFRFIHVLGAGETLTADEASEALDVLNGIIEEANITKLLGYYKTEIVFPCVANQSVYTIGPASTTPHVTAPRPVEILSGFSRRSNVDIPMFIANKEDYDNVRVKNTAIAGWQQMAYYEPAWPKGSLTLYQVPLDNATSIYLTVKAEIPVFASLDSSVSLPPVYTFWMIYKLGERLSPEYGMQFTDKMDTILKNTESALKRNNIKPMPIAGTGLSGLSSNPSGKYNVYSDGGNGR